MHPIISVKNPVAFARPLLCVVMKAADLGHTALPWRQHTKWVERLEAELFAQGDQEKSLGLPVSFLMDREKPGASATQSGFYDFMVLPMFKVLVHAAPLAEPVLEGAMANRDRWLALTPSSEPKVKIDEPVEGTEGAD